VCVCVMSVVLCLYSLDGKVWIVLVLFFWTCFFCSFWQRQAITSNLHINRMQIGVWMS